MTGIAAWSAMSSTVECAKVRRTMTSTQRSTIVRDVVQALAGIDATAGLVHEKGRPAQARHARLKGQPRTQ